MRGVQFGSVRSAYAKICSYKFKPEHLGEDPYFAQILGHTLIPGRDHPTQWDRVIKTFTLKLEPLDAAFVPVWVVPERRPVCSAPKRLGTNRRANYI